METHSNAQFPLALCASERCCAFIVALTMSKLNPQIALLLAKQVLKDKAYTYRQSAPVLGIHFTHLCLVLTGKRISASLLRRISELPPRGPAPDAASAPEVGKPTGPHAS